MIKGTETLSVNGSVVRGNASQLDRGFGVGVGVAVTAGVGVDVGLKVGVAVTTKGGRGV